MVVKKEQEEKEKRERERLEEEAKRREEQLKEEFEKEEMERMRLEQEEQQAKPQAGNKQESEKNENSSMDVTGFLDNLSNSSSPQSENNRPNSRLEEKNGSDKGGNRTFLVGPGDQTPISREPGESGSSLKEEDDEEEEEENLRMTKRKISGSFKSLRTQNKPRKRILLS